MATAAPPPPATYVVCALDAFKGTLTSYRGGEAVELAFRAFQDATREQPRGASLVERPIVTPHTALQFIHSPMSDGGAGLLDSLTYVPPHRRGGNGGNGDASPAALTAQFVRVFVPPHVHITGPLGTPLSFRQPTAGEDAGVGVSFACDVRHRVIVIEMAEASGLPRISEPSQRSPAQTTSYGTGELIAYSLEHMQSQLDAHWRCTQKAAAAAATPHASRRSTTTTTTDEHEDDYGVSVYVGIGGSATNDGGLGALQALGLRIYVTDATATATAATATTTTTTTTAPAGDVLLTRPFTGADLARITRVEVGDEMRSRFFHGGRCVGAAVPSPRRVYVKHIYLICDVNNPLTGPRGATFVFGPQKCAPITAATATGGGGSGAAAVAEDAPVGEVGSAAQMAMLQQLEHGMCNAAVRTVASLWRGAAQQHLRTAPVTPSPCDAQLRRLMHGIGGGGAGGMSGFFHYVLGATWLPGADAVAALLGLRNEATTTTTTPTATATATAKATTTTVAAAASRAVDKGLLYSNCDVVVSGEGSFDTQTILYRKTVGRLLEMAVEANVWRLGQHARVHGGGAGVAKRPRQTGGDGGSPTAAGKDKTQQQQQQRQVAAAAAAAEEEETEMGRDGPRLIRDFVVVCGRCGFKSIQQCRIEVLAVLKRRLLATRPGAPAAGAAAGAEGEGEGELTAKLHALAQQLSCDGRPCTAAEVLQRVVPRVTVLPLSPSPFTVRQAMTDTYNCVRHRIEDYLTETYTGVVRARQCDSKV